MISNLNNNQNNSISCANRTIIHNNSDDNCKANHDTIRMIKNNSSKAATMMANFDKIKIHSTILLYYSLLLIIIINSITLINANNEINNICGATDNFLFCNCDNHESASEAGCFTIGKEISSNDSKWLWFDKHKSLKRLKLSGYNGVSLQEFPKQLFESKTLRNSLHDIVLSDLNIKTLPKYAFKDMNELRIIDISLCSQMIIEPLSFDNLMKLEKIVMTKNNIAKLPKMFRSLPSLRELYLEDNNIATFDDDVFVPLINLNYLTLDNNKIEKLFSKYFNGLSELNSLDLRYNQIKHLPRRVFKNLIKLEILDLSHNQIVDIDEEAFAGLKQLKELQLEYNKLKHIGTQLRVMTNLIEIDLDGNEIEALSKYSFHRPDQKRFVSMKLRNNQLFCNCQLFWLKEAFDLNRENFNYNSQQRCYLGQGQYSNTQTIVQYLMDNNTIDLCTYRLPSTMSSIDDLDNETEPIETIDSIDDSIMNNNENENEKIQKIDKNNLYELPTTDGEKNSDDDEPKIIEKIDENDLKDNSKDNIVKNEKIPELPEKRPKINKAGFDQSKMNENGQKDNGCYRLYSFNSILLTSTLSSLLMMKIIMIL